MYSLPPYMTNLPRYQHQAPEYTFVTIHGPILTHHYHPKSIAYIRFHSRCYIFYGFWKCIATYIYYCSIKKNSFTVLKSSVLCLFIIRGNWFPLPTGNYWSFHCLQGLAFSGMLYRWNHTFNVALSRRFFFHIAVCIQGSSTSLHDLIAHFFLALNNKYSKLPRWLSGKESTCQCRICRFNP